MNLPIFRKIFKELNILRGQEPRIASHASALIRNHVHLYKQQLPRMSSKLKKQDDRALAQAFLTFLQTSNQKQGTIQSLRVKKKLVQVYMGINQDVNEECHLRKNRPSTHILHLHKNQQYLSLQSDTERRWVTNVLDSLFRGEQHYDCPNLTTFFSEAKSSGKEKTSNDVSDVLSRLRPDRLQYVKKVLQGQYKDVGEEFLKIYREYFEKDSRSGLERVLESYRSSRYILLDLEMENIQKIRTRK